MKVIREEKLNKELKQKKFDFPFNIEQAGLYGIEITASAKNWRQNLFRWNIFSEILKSKRDLLRILFNPMSFRFKDDNLTVKIDNISFDKRARWNGNHLKRLRKTNFFITHFYPGIHTLNFLIKQHPTLESIRIFQIEESTISYLPKDNPPPEEGNRRQWLTIVLVNLGLDSLFIQASAKQGKKYLFFRRDSDDLKLIINGEIQRNPNPKVKLHKYWYWCGRILKGDSETFEKGLNLAPDLHYIELWADRSPEVEDIELELSGISKGEHKRIPTVDDPKWTGDFRDDPEEILLARLIFGEAEGEPREAKVWVAGAVINRVKTKRVWKDTIKEVILQSGQYDPFKPSDPRYEKIIDPLDFKGSNELTRRSWYQCYEIAQDIISGAIKNPTTATHFHGKDVTRKWFEAKVVPNGRFLKKIGDTSFYWGPN